MIGLSGLYLVAAGSLLTAWLSVLVPVVLVAGRVRARASK